MEEPNITPNSKAKAHVLNKKVKRLEKSRCLVKQKNREKRKIIKSYQDRQVELKQNRDKWKEKCKEQEKEREELDKKYKHIANLFQIKEEQLMEVLKEFEELKKKYPEQLLKMKKRA